MPFIAAGHVKKGNPATNRLTYIVGVPAHTVGDRMYIAIVAGADGSTFSALSGWTTFYNNVSVAGAATLSVYTRIATDTEPVTVEITTSVKDKAVWICWSVTDDNGTNAQGTSASGTGATATIPTLTTTVANTLVMGVVAGDRNVTPFGTPSGWTKLDEHTFGSASSIAVYYKVRALSDVEPAVSVTLGTSEQWAGISFAIAPTVIIVEPWRLSGRLTGTSNVRLANIRRQFVLAAILSAASAVSVPGLVVERPMDAALTADSAVSLADLRVSNSWRMVAIFTGQSGVSAAIVLVRRYLIALATGTSGASATLVNDREFAARLTAASVGFNGVVFYAIAMALVRGGIEAFTPSAEVDTMAPSGEVDVLMPSGDVEIAMPSIVVVES